LSSDSNNKNATLGYKSCAGKNCKKKGIHYLRIRFVKKFGWFCDSCKDFLIEDKLIDKVDGARKTKTNQIFERKGISQNEQQ
jgi:hypothetical protein